MNRRRAMWLLAAVLLAPPVVVPPAAPPAGPAALAAEADHPPGKPAQGTTFLASVQPGSVGGTTGFTQGAHSPSVTPTGAYAVFLAEPAPPGPKLRGAAAVPASLPPASFAGSDPVYRQDLALTTFGAVAMSLPDGCPAPGAPPSCRTWTDGAAVGAIDASGRPDLSNDATRVVFPSRSSGLVNPVITNLTADDNVYLRRTTDNRTFLASRISVLGSTAIGGHDPRISGDGSTIVFTTTQSGDLPHRVVAVAGTDAVTGSIFFVPSYLQPAGGAPDGDSRGPVVDRTGRYVAFTTDATNFVSGDGNGASDAVLWDRDTGHYTLLSVALDGTAAGGASDVTNISADGRLVAFQSSASNLVGGDTNGQPDAFLFDRDPDRNGVFYDTDHPGEPHRIVRVSVDGDGAEYATPGLLEGPELAPDGTAVAFASTSALIPGDTNGIADAYVRDIYLEAPGGAVPIGLLDRVSVPTDGTQLTTGKSAQPAISDEGRAVVFTSSSTELSSALAPDGGSSVEVYGRRRPSTLAYDPNDVTIPLQRVGTPSTPISIPLENLGPAVTTSNFPGISVVDGDFSAADFEIVKDCGFFSVGHLYDGLNPPCDEQVVFTPSTSGAGTVELIAGFRDVAFATIHVSAARGVLNLQPDPVQFPVQHPGTTSAPQTVTVTNIGSVATTITAATVGNAAFAVASDGCSGLDLAPEASCQIDVTFTPPTDGSFSSALVVGSDADNSEAFVTLLGPGNHAELTIAPTAHDFGLQKRLTTSAPVTFTVTNVPPPPPGGGGAPPPVDATITAVEVTGLPSTAGQPFRVVTDGCSGHVLALNASCTVDVVFRPGEVASFTGQIRVVSDADNTPVARLLGTGAAGHLTIDPPAHDYGSNDTGTVTPPTTFTVTNEGPVDAVLTGTGLQGDQPGEFAVTADGCGTATLSPGATCLVSVEFRPRFAGIRSATLAVANDGDPNPATAALSGTARPILIVNPGLGRPKEPTQAIGSGFPPEQVVHLRWIDNGIPAETDVMAATDGTFTIPMLVLDRDQLGTRRCEASGAGYDPVTAPYLVVPPTMQPPGFVIRG